MSLKIFFNNLFKETRVILFEPQKHWDDVKNGKSTFSEVYKRYFLPVLLILFLSIITGDFIFKSQYGFLLKDAIIKAMLKITSLVFLLYISMWFIYEISRIFKANPDFESARKIAIYSMAPAVVLAVITGLFPFLDLLGILSLYGFYLAYLGMNKLFKIPGEKKQLFIIVTVLSILLAALFINFILYKLTAIIIY